MKKALIVFVALLATSGAAGCDNNKPAGGPPGWVEVPCEPWPGGKGPCYAPPEGDSYIFNGQRCTITNGRNVCKWITPSPTKTKKAGAPHA